MNVFEEAEMELGCEPDELFGTFPAQFVSRVTCPTNHENLTPHQKWDIGRWYWTCNDCYNRVSNQFVTDRMRESGNE